MQPHVLSENHPAPVGDRAPDLSHRPHSRIVLESPAVKSVRRHNEIEPPVSKGQLYRPAREKLHGFPTAPSNMLTGAAHRCGRQIETNELRGQLAKAARQLSKTTTEIQNPRR